MKAMALKEIASLKENSHPLQMMEFSDPTPRDKEVLVKVSTCGVCHTELDEIEGRTPPPRFPVILGHEVVGRVEQKGDSADKFMIGDRVGIGWIHSACGRCRFCLKGDENLCPEFRATGRDADGGYAEYMVVHEDFAFRIPDLFSDAEAAPLLCAGAIGHRSLKLADMEDGLNLGLTGFGASAHLVLMMARHQYPKAKLFVFARNERERDFARELGAIWAGDTGDRSPENLDCIIDTTPAWKPVLEGLKNLRPGGRIVINAIRKEEGDKNYLLNIDYPTHLWLEKEIKSVANVARADIGEFLQLAEQIPIVPEVQEFRLEDANMALMELKQRKIRGAKVLRID
ncbi:MAG: zinc-dependent alcohol dehydrogenase family protein [Desulfatiglans sp.]|jgi:propanol-preferring alcohol dehydrogenase|nr:zinc-dependent alcohol dehydrogenase family protein [Thermodesulfobacteriota bacterium]MEE4351521.1 zinc-dependent alcohol dehydrogenase family protein [Desulfatiglans sp.]